MIFVVQGVVAVSLAKSLQTLTQKMPPICRAHDVFDGQNRQMRFKTVCRRFKAFCYADDVLYYLARENASTGVLRDYLRRGQQKNRHAMHNGSLWSAWGSVIPH